MPEVNESVSLKTQCSCYACEPLNCFAKRHMDKKCSCFDCLNQQTCLFVNTLNKTYGNYDLLDYKEQQESFNKELNEENIDVYNSTTTVIKKQSKVSFKSSLIEKSAAINSKSFNDNNILVSRKTSASTAKLSAQIMNVPYEEFEDSLYKTKPNNSKLLLENLFQKIKDVYKVCSCKVCDCIGITNNNSEICNCKPCDCNDCKSFKKTLGRQLLKSSQGSCSKITNSKQKCECKPCECIQCTETKSEPCDCEPCHCFECRSHKLCNIQTLVVAAVGDDNRNVPLCHCAPCSCVECVRNHCASTNETRHEMSTGLNRHPRCQCETCNNEACVPDSNDTCKCERPVKLMRKPFQSHNTDYDIRRSEISQAVHRDKRHSQDMIAMFAQISNRYPNNVCQSKINGNECSCDQCQCLNCSYGKSLADSVKSSNTFISNNIHKINKNVNCKCSSCECKFCTDKDNVTMNLAGKKSMKCEKSYRLNSGTFNKYHKDSSTRKMHNKLSPKGKFTDCSKIVTKCTGNICDCNNCKCDRCVAKGNIPNAKYPVINEEFRFENKVNHKANLCKNNNDSSINSFVRSHPSKTISFNSYHHRDTQTKGTSYSKKHNMKKIVKTAGTIKYAQIYIDSSKQTANKIAFDDNTESEYSSSSNCDESGTISPESSCKKKTCSNLCDNLRTQSHIHNHQKQYPKSTVAKCLNDVIMLNMDTDVNLKEITKTSELNCLKKTLDVFPNFYDTECVKNVLINEKVSSKSRSLKTFGRKTASLSNDVSSFHENISLRSQQVSFYNSDSLIKKEDSFNKHLKANQSDQNGMSQEKKKKMLNVYYNNFKDNHIGTEENFKSWKTQKSLIYDTDLDEDYERVQKTVKRFSHQLVKLLNKYEIANKEFESVFKKLKYSKSFNMNTVRENRIHKAKNTAHRNKVFDKVYQNDEQKIREENKDVNVQRVDNLNKLNFNKSLMMYDENLCDIIENCDEGIIKFNNGLSKQLQSKNYAYNTENSFLLDSSIHCKSNLNPIVEESELPRDYIYCNIKEDTMQQSETNYQCLMRSKREKLEKESLLSEFEKYVIPDNMQVLGDLQEKANSQSYENVETIRLLYESKLSRCKNISNITKNCDGSLIKCNNNAFDLQENISCQVGPYVHHIHLLNNSKGDSYDILCHENIRDIIGNCDGAVIEFDNSFNKENSDCRKDRTHFSQSIACNKCNKFSNVIIRDIIQGCNGAINKLSFNEDKNNDFHIGPKVKDVKLLNVSEFNDCTFSNYENISDLIDDCDGAVIEFNECLNFQENQNQVDVNVDRMILIHKSNAYKYNIVPKESVRNIIENHDGALIEFNYGMSNVDTKDSKNSMLEGCTRSKSQSEYSLFKKNLNHIIEEKEILTDPKYCLLTEEMNMKKLKYTKMTSPESELYRPKDMRSLINAPKEFLNIEPTAQQNISGDKYSNRVKSLVNTEQPHWSKGKTWFPLKNYFFACDYEMSNTGIFKQPFEGETNEDNISKKSSNAVVHEGSESVKQEINSIAQDDMIEKRIVNEILEREIDNNAFSHIHSEIKNLLNYPLLEKLQATKNEMAQPPRKNYDRLDETTKYNRVKQKVRPANKSRTDDMRVAGNQWKETEVRSCEAFKVSSLTVQSMSEHTIMLRWEAPRVLDNVQYYELLVDGRAVQKNINTTRCVAMVTGLPQSDNVLLTIRTITVSPCHFGHLPSTTVVYKRKLCHV